MFFVNQTIDIKENEVTIVSKVQKDQHLYLFAFYIYEKGKVVDKIMYTASNKLTINLLQRSSIFYVRCFFKHKLTNEIFMFDTEPVKLPRIEARLDSLDYASNFDGDIKVDNMKFPVLYKPKFLGTKRLYVFLNGAVAINVQNKYYPYFSRISWENKFEGHCLYLYDVSLNLVSDYTLGWYLGTTHNRLMENYIHIIKTFAKNLNIDYENIVLYGSSCGGFAAIKMAEQIDGSTAVAINPQTNILDYNVRAAVNKFTSVFDVSSYPHLVKIDVEKLTKAHAKIILVQNIQDNHHYEKHYKPLVEQLSNAQLYPNNPNYKCIIYDHESGHGGEPEDVFEEILAVLKK